MSDIRFIRYSLIELLMRFTMVISNCNDDLYSKIIHIFSAIFQKGKATFSIKKLFRDHASNSIVCNLFWKEVKL
jgi:hypothetical protein